MRKELEREGEIGKEAGRYRQSQSDIRRELDRETDNEKEREIERERIRKGKDTRARKWRATAPKRTPLARQFTYGSYCRIVTHTGRTSIIFYLYIFIYTHIHIYMQRNDILYICMISNCSSNTLNSQFNCTSIVFLSLSPFLDFYHQPSITSSRQ